MGSKVPKKEVMYFVQMFILLVVILSCILNLSIPGLQAGENPVPKELWIILLSTCLGCILPSPKMHADKHFLSPAQMLAAESKQPRLSSSTPY